MLEFWTQELSAISAACSIIIGAVGLTYEQVKGWEKIVPKSK